MSARMLGNEGDRQAPDDAVTAKYICSKYFSLVYAIESRKDYVVCAVRLTYHINLLCVLFTEAPTRYLLKKQWSQQTIRMLQEAVQCSP